MTAAASSFWMSLLFISALWKLKVCRCRNFSASQHQIHYSRQKNTAWVFSIRKVRENIRAWRRRNWKSLKHLNGCISLGSCLVLARVNIYNIKFQNLSQSDTKLIGFVTWVLLHSRTVAAGQTRETEGCKEAASSGADWLFRCHGAHTENMAVRLVAWQSCGRPWQYAWWEQGECVGMPELVLLSVCWLFRLSLYFVLLLQGFKIFWKRTCFMNGEPDRKLV